MPQGFFHKSTLSQSKPPISTIPQCGACGLHKQCKSPKMPVSGKGKKSVLIVGEAPGADEDEENRQFIGRTGEYLEKTLRRFDLDMREDCWLTNTLICRPPKNRNPSDDEIDYCRPNLLNTIEELKPEFIFVVGGAAVQSLIGFLWKDDPGTISRWRGWRIPSQRLNAWICPIWHPSYILRNDYGSGKKNEVVELIWEQDIENAVRLVGSRPWDHLPNYEKQVERCLDVERVCKVLEWFAQAGGSIAFDYETNMLKPDSKEAVIVSCAVCWNGKWTIAYPWHGKAIEATKELLLSDLYKTAHNMKFEDRWSQAKLGIRVRRWRYCSMNGAHLIDNRENITGLKFQAFVMMGMESYDDHIKPLLQAESGAKVNQVLKEISIDDLLKYNGIDAISNYHVAKKQLEVLGWPDLLPDSNVEKVSI